MRVNRRRLAMKLFAVHPVVWLIFLGLWVSYCYETESNNPDVCQQDLDTDLPYIECSSGHEETENRIKVNQNFSCYLHPRNLLNCSWSLQDLQKDEQLSVHISVCDNNTTTDVSWNGSSMERVGSKYLNLHGNVLSFVVFQFNMSLHDQWTSFTFMYDMDFIDIPSPPSNISATVKDEYLTVTWNLPGTQSPKPVGSNCFEYQVYLGYEQGPINISEKLFYSELYDPNHTYEVKIRVQKKNSCGRYPAWSEWSHSVSLEKSVYKLNKLVIISISLGIPMILLAVLLLVRYQRVSELLFPPIPCPPPKYIYFLEKNDPSSFFHLAQPVKVEEEITEVEDTKENTGKIL
ncbi:hypothetical protein Q5P01_022080 [Channa striata]|uniref:Fibronectin type-III domain-containing protein n=1 Tax=Channa striata TaxID=64152 RepID=A0AA88LRA9_CHASR|nr:hypothetical protein Q5P01_022080 [Channa striata]